MKKFISAHAKSIEFLLEHAGPVIRYRLRREILQDLSSAEAEECAAVRSHLLGGGVFVAGGRRLY